MPYREAGEFINAEDRRRRWKAEYDMLAALNTVGRSEDELHRMIIRRAELARLLAADMAATVAELLR